jgi:hypothetical protein
MIEIRKTSYFAKWIDSLQDIRARARIQARIERLVTGNPGDVKPVGDGISEIRIDLYRRRQAGDALSGDVMAQIKSIVHTHDNRKPDRAKPDR